MTSIELYSHILDSLDTKSPVSIVRAGDGEQMLMSGKNTSTDQPHNMMYVIDRQLGYKPPLKTCLEIRDRLIQAFTYADIIGIPVKNRFLADPNSSWSKVKPTLEKYVDTSNKIYTDIDFHSHFLDQGLFKELFRKIDKLYYISCRDITAQLVQRYRIKVHAFHIAPEMKFSPEYKGKSHLEQIPMVREWISQQDIDGALCLFGAGVIGKIYGNWFRDAGGVAVDVGSVFDSLYGLKTRGIGRGAGVIDNTFKL